MAAASRGSVPGIEPTPVAAPSGQRAGGAGGLFVRVGAGAVGGLWRRGLARPDPGQPGGGERGRERVVGAHGAARRGSGARRAAEGVMPGVYHLAAWARRSAQGTWISGPVQERPDLAACAEKGPDDHRRPGGQRVAVIVALPTTRSPA